MNNLLFTIITFYEFKEIKDKVQFQKKLKDFCKFNKIRGTIIIANEGINGTICGYDKSIKKLLLFLKSQKFNNIKPRFSYFKYMPFNRLKIRKKNEIVTFRSKLAKPEVCSGKKINVKDWNKVVDDKKTLLIDVRNNFEIELGSFNGATNPRTKSFTEFKYYVEKKLKNSKNKKIAIFCTGGIRCEKASSYMISKGFNDVSQLEGGILKYLEKTSIKKSRWKGECFVFDSRVSVKNELKEGTYDLCHACRHPVSEDEKKSSKFKNGISCPKCYGKISNKKIKNLKERNKQILISKRKGIYNPYIKQTTSNF